ncbi:hypothetical protein HYDPIDRAFT_108735 [Hydnomerulius pinastri MD-312]|nr:hypothetical protein HYDPIDRAFT_108735 [Hydnomerulius pinastri MD-312]
MVAAAIFKSLNFSMNPYTQPAAEINSTSKFRETKPSQAPTYLTEMFSLFRTSEQSKYELYIAISLDPQRPGEAVQHFTLVITPKNVDKQTSIRRFYIKLSAHAGRHTSGTWSYLEETTTPSPQDLVALISLGNLQKPVEDVERIIRATKLEEVVRKAQDLGFRVSWVRNVIEHLSEQGAINLPPNFSFHELREISVRLAVEESDTRRIVACDANGQRIRPTFIKVLERVH